MYPDDLAYALNPAKLLGAAGFTLDHWQRDFLSRRPRRALLLCARQTGKSTSAAALALHQAFYHPRSLILLLSPSLRQSQELFHKVLALCRALPPFIPLRRESSLRLEFANDSRILSLPGKEDTLRGFSQVSLLVIDEAARVPDDLYFAVRPMLAVSRGRLAALSTPWGRRGWFYKCYTKGGPGWERIKVTALDCPRISPQFLQEEQAALPQPWFAAEYLCEFLDPANQLFPSERVMAAVTDQVKPLF